MKPTKQMVLAVMAHASKQELSKGYEGWVSLPPDLRGKCQSLVRDGLAEAGDNGSYRPTALGYLTAPDVESMQ